MKIDQFKSVIRSVIREELDYHFAKLLKEIKDSGGEQRLTERVVSKPSPKKVEEERKQLRKKFGGILGMVTEGMDVDGIEGEMEGAVKSILDDDTMESLGRSKNEAVAGVARALTRDYSHLINR